MNQVKDVRGEKYNNLLIIGLLPRKKTKWGSRKQVRVLCDCGNEKDVDYKNIKAEKIKSCGCISNKIDIFEGEVYNNYTIIKEVDPYISPKGEKSRRFLCKCICGEEREVNLSSLRGGRIKSCGCIKPEYKKRKESLPIKPLDIDSQNKRDLGVWTVIREISNYRNEKGEIKRNIELSCEKGHLKTVFEINPKAQCLECMYENFAAEKETKEHKERQKIRNIHAAMKARCYNPNSKDYKRYGERGIKVCDEWLKFKCFYEWVITNGYEQGLQIDRINNDEDYTPTNCRFTTHADNNRNTSRNVLNWELVNKIRYGEYKDLSISEVSMITNISRYAISEAKKFNTWKI